MTPPNRITISAGIDQRTNSRRPSYDSSGLRLARRFDDRYHQANAKVARTTGTTTTSMIAVELISRSSSCAAIGPCGSSTPTWRQEATTTAAHTTSPRSKREWRGRCRALDAGPSGASGVAQGQSCMEASDTEGGTKNAAYVAPKFLTSKSSENAAACQSRAAWLGCMAGASWL